MKLRKINAVFSLISTILLFAHAISLAVWMAAKTNAPKLPRAMPRVLTVVFVLHAVISIVLMITAHKDKPERKGKGYIKLNSATLVQRISGVLMIVLTVMHILGALNVMHTPRPVFLITTTLFFIVVFAHIAISTSKAFITLGIGNAKFVKCVDIVIKVICVATLIADIVGLYILVG